MSGSKLHEQRFDTMGVEGDAMSIYGNTFATWQRNVNWWIGDLAIAARNQFGDNYSQAFPPEMSPGLIQRCEAVARAFPPEQRDPQCTWTQHMQVSKRADRLELLEGMHGQTSDESRQDTRKRWLLAVDVNYYIHRFWHSGAGVEAAESVASWIERTVARLREKGLTDVACCFDSKTNHRKKLTEDWEHKYKDRPKKDEELYRQIDTARELIQRANFTCVQVDGMEADDCMASYAAQFPGRVTLLTQDKDCRQCLSSTCNMLLDVDWEEDSTSGQMLPVYKWLSAKDHTEETGVSPDKWTEFQTLMGDNCDGIKGAVGIGKKLATDFVQKFGSARETVEAAKRGDESMTAKKREALIEFEPFLDVTKQLVTLRTDVVVPMTTRLTEVTK